MNNTTVIHCKNETSTSDFSDESLFFRISGVMKNIPASK